MISRLFVFCFVLLLSLFTRHDAVAGRHRDNFCFETLYIDEGLHYDPVYQIIQDQKGLLWFGSTDGLHRYDGYRFVSFRNLPGDSTSLPNNVIRALFADPKGQIWIGTQKGGLACYSYPGRQFRTFRFAHFTAPYPSMDAIAQTAGSLIWVASQEQGLFYLDPFTHQLIKYRSVSIPKAYSLYSDQQNLYIGSTGKIFVLNGRRHKATIALQWQNQCYENTIVKSMAADDKGQLWVGTAGQGIFILDMHTQRITAHYAADTPGPVSFDNYINAIFPDKQQRIWILSQDNGVLLYKQLSREFVRISKNEFVKGSLSDNRCYSAFEDKNGIIWLGTYSGINKYDCFRNKFDLYYHNPFDSNSLSDNFVSSVYEDTQKKLWIGTRDGYINLLDRQKSLCQRIKLNKDKQPCLPLSIYPLDSLCMLVGTDKGLFAVQRKNHRVSYFAPFKKQKFDTGKIRQLVPYRQHYLLIGCDNGLIVYDRKRESFTHYLHNDITANPADTHIKVIYVDQQENIWLGTAAGLQLFDLDSGKSKVFNLSPENPYINNVLVMSILRLNDQLWLGTYNYGLYCMDLTSRDLRGQFKGSFVQYTKAQGLPNDVVYGILADRQNNLWLSTNKGIARFNSKELVFTNFDEYDGLQNNEFNLGAYMQSRSGEMFFGGIRGLNAFYPQDIQPNPFMPEVQLSHLTIINRTMSNSQTHPEIPLTGEKYLELSHLDNFFTIHFMATHYSVPTRNQFAYKMENFDNDWVYAGQHHSATYTNLKPGHYIFRVKAANADGLWNKHYTSLHIYIAPAFWQTWWFLLLVLMALAGTMTGILHQRLRRDRHIKQLLEQQIRERTREILVQKEVIEMQNKDLQASKEQLTQLNHKKDLIFSILSHDLRSPLTTLQGFLTLLIQYYDSFTAEEIKMHAEKIKNSVSTSLDLIDNILFWSQSQLGGIIYKPLIINLKSLAEKTISLYQLSAEKKNLQLSSCIPDDIYVYADENMLFVVLRNLVSNAIKFTKEGGQVMICARLCEYKVELSVKDTGIGISEDNLEKLLDYNSTFTTRGTSNEKGTGLGLSLCKKFIELNEGKLRIKSTPGEGSEFIITLQIARKKIPAAS